MTIEELNKLSDEANYENALNKFYKLYGDCNIIPKETDLNFWSNILDGVTDEETKQMLFVLITELAWYKRLDVGYDIEELEEIFNADVDDRLIISPFAVGDNIIADDSRYPMKVTAIVYDKYGLNIKTERYECVTRYDFNEYKLNGKELRKYKVTKKDPDGCIHITHYA